MGCVAMGEQHPRRLPVDMDARWLRLGGSGWVAQAALHGLSARGV